MVVDIKTTVCISLIKHSLLLNTLYCMCRGIHYFILTAQNQGTIAPESQLNQVKQKTILALQLSLSGLGGSV